MSLPSEKLEDLKKESAQDSMSHIPFAWGKADSKGELTLEIDPMVFYKIMHWIDKEDYEVSGLGTIEVDHERNVMRVTDAILLKQENTSATTEIDAQATLRAMHEFRQRGSAGQLKWWWHSHVNMGVFWSGTDEAAIKCLGGATLDQPAWFVATVFNQRREMLTAYVQNRPIKLIQTEIETKIRQRLSADTVASWDAEYDEKVELPTTSVSPFLGDDDGESKDEAISELFRQWREKQEAKQKAEAQEEGEEEEAEAEEIETSPQEESGLLEEMRCGMTEPSELFDLACNGLITLNELFEVHDAGFIDDDELDMLYASHPGDDDDVFAEDDEEEEKQAMDIGPVPKKQLKSYGDGSTVIG
jgi:proteasome lid subunit RPN8/RPN11